MSDEDREYILFLKQVILDCDDYELISTCFDMKATDVAKLFNMSDTTFKNNVGNVE